MYPFVDDTCIFGVKVFVIKGHFRGECLSMINQPQSDYFTWKNDEFMASKVEADMFEQLEGEDGMIGILLTLVYQSQVQVYLSLICNLFSSYFGYRMLFVYPTGGGTELARHMVGS
jgi:hypothetical protein